MDLKERKRAGIAGDRQRRFHLPLGEIVPRGQRKTRLIKTVNPGIEMLKRKAQRVILIRLRGRKTFEIAAHHLQ